jgi:hypothetical protein
MEDNICSGCGAEPLDPIAPIDDLLNEGWYDSEYGLICPECRANEPQNVETVAPVLSTEMQVEIKTKKKRGPRAKKPKVNS